MKTCLAVLRTIAAVLLSILLVAVLLIVPLHRTLAGVTQPKRLAAMAGNVVRNTDITAVVELPEQLELGEHKLDTTASKKILEAPVTKDILGDCTEQIILAATTGEATDALTEDKVSTILSGRMDDLTTLVKDTVPEAQDVSADDIQKQLAGNLTQLSQAVMKELPSEEELQQLTGVAGNKVNKPATSEKEPATDAPNKEESTPDKEETVDTPAELDQKPVTDTSVSDKAQTELGMVRQLLSPTVNYILWGAAILLAVLVLLCRLRHLNGLVWVGTDILLAGGLLLTGCLWLTGDRLSSLIAQEPTMQALLDSTLRVVVKDVQTGAILLLIIGALFLIGGIVCNILLKKRQATAPAITA